MDEDGLWEPPAFSVGFRFRFLAVLFPWFNFLFANAKGEGQLVWEEEIVHAGDLIVDGNQTFLIENYTTN
jgi:hypothetical protein